MGGQQSNALHPTRWVARGIVRDALGNFTTTVVGISTSLCQTSRNMDFHFCLRNGRTEVVGLRGRVAVMLGCDVCQSFAVGARFEKFRFFHIFENFACFLGFPEFWADPIFSDYTGRKKLPHFFRLACKKITATFQAGL